MLKKIFITLLVFPLGIVYGQNRKIKFENTTLSAALVKAKTENKLVFVDCFTTWCIPCKQMDQQIFTIDSIADYFNANFINVQLDMEQEEGKLAQGKYKVEAYPSFLLLNSDGNVMYKFVGGMPVEEFMAKIKEGVKPNNNIFQMNKMYAEGNRSKAFLREYIKVKIDMMEISEGVQIAEEYFKMLSAEERTLPENWFLFEENRYSNYLSGLHSENFNYLANHWKEFAIKNGQEAVEAKLALMYRKIAEYSLQGWYFKSVPFQKAEFDQLQKQIANTELGEKDQFIALMDISKACGEQDTLKVSKLFEKHFASFSKQNQQLIYDYMPMFFGKPKINGYNELMSKVALTAKDPKLREFIKKSQNQ